MEQGRTRVSASEALVTTAVDGNSAAISSGVSISADSTNRLQTDTSFRLPTTTFNTNAAAMRYGNARLMGNNTVMSCRPLRVQNDVWLVS